MKLISVVVVSIVVLLSTTEARFNYKIRRQSGTCVLTYISLSSDEQDCLSYNDGFSIDQMERLCSSQTCITAAKKLLQGCKSDIEQQLPEEYRSIDIEAFLDLFCTKASDGNFCYSNLPLFNNTMDPIGSCESVLDGAACNGDCHQGLEHYNSTCCFASYLTLVPVNQYSIRPTDLWSRCQIVSPQLCNASTNVSGSTGTDNLPPTDNPSNTDNPPNTDHPPNTDGSPNTDHPTASGGNNGKPVGGSGLNGGTDDDDDDDEDDNEKYGYIGIAVGAIMVIVITIVAALITLLVWNRKRSRSSATGSRDTMRMSLAMNEDPDD